MLFKGVKGQDLPVTTLVIIILAIIVFAIVLYIFTSKTGESTSALNQCSGECQASCASGYAKIPGTCTDTTKPQCCQKIFGTATSSGNSPPSSTSTI